MRKCIRFLKSSNKRRYDSTKLGKPPFESGEFRGFPKTVCTMVIAFDCLPELKGKTLFLETQGCLIQDNIYWI